MLKPFAKTIGDALLNGVAARRHQQSSRPLLEVLHPGTGGMLVVLVQHGRLQQQSHFFHERALRALLRAFGYRPKIAYKHAAEGVAQRIGDDSPPPARFHSIQGSGLGAEDPQPPAGPDRQYRTDHPYTNSRAGGWGRTHLAGAVPDTDGGWGAEATSGSTIEETALAVAALVRYNEGKAAAARGAEYLVRRVEDGTWRRPAPIGLYFARLRYSEKLYPVIWTLNALSHARANGVELY